MAWTRKALFFLLVLFASVHIRAQSDTFHITALQESYSLSSHCDLLALDSDTLSIGEVLQPEWNGRFIPYSRYLSTHHPGRDPNRRIKLDNTKTYWARVHLINQLPEECMLENWYLFAGKSDETTVYLIGKDGGIRQTKYAGYMVSSEKKDLRFGLQYEDRVMLNLQPQDTVTLLIKLKPLRKRPPWLNIVLTRMDFYQTWPEVVKISKNWLFIGFLLTFSILSLLLYIVTRDKVFLYHALFQLGVFIYLLEFFSILIDLPFLREHPVLLQSVLFMALCLMDVSYLLFIRTFLKLWEKYPFWDQAVKALIGVRVVVMIIAILIFYVFEDMRLADNISALFIVAEYFAMVLLLLFIRESGTQRLFLLGGTLLLTVGIVSNALSVVAGTGIQFSYTQIGGFGEVLLFTLGLGFRMKRLIQEERKNLVLKEIDEFKTRFYTNITHEFRTPLTVIQGFTEQLRQQLKDPEQLQQLSLIRKNGERLVRLVNRILELSKLQSGRMELKLQQSDIVEFVRYMVYSYQSFAWSKGIHMSFLSDQEGLKMDFDVEKLQDVLTNLISNAIKFTPEEGRITVLMKEVTSGLHKGQLLIQVKDTGVGMSPHELEHLFERFHQSEALRKKGQGTGLGLSITRELVKLMGGTIEASSKEGAGATFSIYLPISREAPEEVIQDLPLTDIDLTGEPEKKGFQTEDFDDEKPLALIVEDSYDVVTYLKQLLEKDFNIVVAYDGAEGIEKAIKLVPDIILSDVVMPNKDGLELCKTLKEDQRTSHIPIILATAKATVEDRLAGLKRGADAYLAKPFNQDELFLYLQNFVQLRKKLRRRYSHFPPDEASPASGAEAEMYQMEDAFVTKLRRIVTAHLGAEGFSATQLAREVGMSRSQLHRKLTALSGHSATAFINEIRLNKARELLLQTDLTVSEIAYQIGLEPNYFTRLFREETGVTPSEFRNGQQ